MFPPSMLRRAKTAALITAGALLLGGCSPSASGSVDTAPAPAASVPTAADSSTGDAADTTPAGEPGSLSIVTIGDSIMAGYGIDPGAAWPSLLAEGTGDTVVNLACSGAGFVVEGDCDTDYAGLIAQAAGAHPDVVIVQSSDNDVSESREDIVGETEATIIALHEALPGARIIGLNTLWHLPWEEPRAIAWSTEALRGALTAGDDAFVWIGQPLQGEGDLLQWDEEHPTEAGQEALYSAITVALAKAGIRL